MGKLTALALWAVGVIHLLPVMGVLGAQHLHKLYGIGPLEGDLLVLMRHRAVLFACIGGVMVLSVFVSSLRPIAITMGILSVSSFIIIALSAENLNPWLHRVVTIDCVALFLLVFVALELGWRHLRESL